MKENNELGKSEKAPLEQTTYLGFLYKKISVTQAIMRTWLDYPEFVREIEILIKNGITIDNKTVYEVVKKIYFPLRYDRELYGFAYEEGALNQSRTRNGLRKLCTVLYNNPDFWETEYQEFINQI